MILDTSAVVSIVLQETGFQKLVAKIFQAKRASVGAPTLLETSMVLIGRLGKNAKSELDTFMDTTDAQIIAFETAHWRGAVQAFERYGKGRHPAALNFGDCMSYAVAKLADEPLLFIGNDFSLTDIEQA